jgi:hypothetical protein
MLVIYYLRYLRYLRSERQVETSRSMLCHHQPTKVFYAMTSLRMDFKNLLVGPTSPIL